MDEVILVETNKTTNGPVLEFGKFLWLIWIWILIIANHAMNWEGYFSDTPIDLFSMCSIRVNHFISGNWFDSICSALKFTSKPPPPHPFRDKFDEIIYMINSWNDYMKRFFIPSWILCLD